MSKIYVFKHYPPTPLYPIPLALGCLPCTLILTTPSLKKILDPLLLRDMVLMVLIRCM